MEAGYPSAKADFPREEDDEGQSFGGPGKGQSSSASKSSSETPVLDNFGIDLYQSSGRRQARSGRGREREIERLAQILSRRKRTILC